MCESGEIYVLNDKIAFRCCSLYKHNGDDFGDCTNWEHRLINSKDSFACRQFGIHYHCAKHPNIELEPTVNNTLKCKICGETDTIWSYDSLRRDCLKALNSKQFKNAKLVRINEYYIPQAKNKTLTENYWISTEVKTDKDGDTMIVVYVGDNTPSKDKVQLFIKPEKAQISHDMHDLDPSTLISKIEVTLRDRTFTHDFD